MWRSEPHVPEQDKNVPCCRRRNTPLSRANGPFESTPDNSCHLHALSGGILDHEMSETRETANADMDQVIPRLMGDIASGRAEQDKNVPCCRRRIGFSSGETSGLHGNRGTHVSYRSYAVRSKPGVHLDERLDSPAAAWYLFFFRNCLAGGQTISEKTKLDLRLTVRLFSEGVRKNPPLAGQKRLLGKHLAPHGDENCRNVLHITETCTPKWGECSKFCRFFRLKWDENSI